MKIKTLLGISMSGVMILCAFTGCNRSLSEDEAIMRADHEIEDAFASINNLDLDNYGYSAYDEFKEFGKFDESQLEAIYEKNTDSYIVTCTDAIIRFRCIHPNPINGMVDLYGDVKFDAKMTVYSNGEVHVDKLEYEVVNRD